ncbi:MAG: hypothetical protein V1784_03725, partial [bacterium]
DCAKVIERLEEYLDPLIEQLPAAAQTNSTPEASELGKAVPASVAAPVWTDEMISENERLAASIHGKIQKKAAVQESRLMDQVGTAPTPPVPAAAPTPRIDALLLTINEGRTYANDGPITDIARQLERELAAAIASFGEERERALREGERVIALEAKRRADIQECETIYRGTFAPYESATGCCDAALDKAAAVIRATFPECFHAS